MYLLKWSVNIVWAPDGAGPESGVGNAQSLLVSEAGGTGVPAGAPIIVPGGNAPTQANFNTAVVAIVAPAEAAIAANLAALQGWATGGD